MTPDHQQLIENTLELAYRRTIEWNKSMAVPQGKNPPQYTREILWQCPLAQDLIALANYVEGYSVLEDIIAILSRIARALFGHTLSQTSFRLPHQFHQTPLGEMMYQAPARYYPANAWMTTAQVKRLFSVQRQTIYDWAEEGKLAPYFVKGKQVYLRKDVEKFHVAWQQQKQRKQGIITRLS